MRDPQGLIALQQLLHDWERWAAEILESHVSYPVVSYFRSQHNNESWLGALATILDTTALLIAAGENPCKRQARLTFAMCRHTVVDLAQIFFAAPRNPKRDRLSAIRNGIACSASSRPPGSNFTIRTRPRPKLTELRRMYEPYLQALAVHLYVELPPWILAKEVTDNWRTSAWGRISGFDPEPAKATVFDDH